MEVPQRSGPSSSIDFLINDPSTCFTVNFVGAPSVSSGVERHFADVAARSRSLVTADFEFESSFQQSDQMVIEEAENSIPSMYLQRTSMTEEQQPSYLHRKLSENTNMYP